MAGYRRCDHCEKGSMHGNRVSHAKNRTKRLWLVNLHSKRVWNKQVGHYERKRLCVKCVRKVKMARLTPETRREGYLPTGRYAVGDYV